MIELDGKQFYTFPMFRESEDKLENILFAFLNNDKIDTYIVKYNVTPEDFKTLTNLQIENLTPEFQKINYGGGWVYQCVDSFQVITVYPKCTHPNGIHENGVHCDPVTEVFVTHTCQWIDGGAGGGGGTGNTGTGGTTLGSDGNNGHNSSGINNGGIPTTPILSPEQLAIKDFQMQLSPSQHNCFNSLPNNIQDEINNYIASTLTITVDGFVTANTTNTVYDFAEQIMAQMCSNPEPYSSINPFIIEKNINDSQLDPCGQSILNRLKSLQQNGIASILAKLGSSTNYNLSISTGYPIDPNAFAATSWNVDQLGNDIPYSYYTNIRPEETAVSSDLAIAGTLLHEIVHAYFLSLIDDCHQTSNCAQLQSFQDLWNFYVANQNNGTYTDILSQHEQIANSYVNIMGAALQEFVTGTPVQAGQPILQVYTDIAWYGLSGTIPFNNLPQADKDRINFRFENVELLNQSSTNQNGTTISPVGSRTNPC